MGTARVPPRVSAAYPTGQVPVADIAAAPGNEAFAAEHERWLADRQPTGGLRIPTAEEMARTFEHGEAQLRAQRPADELPLYFGGDPRDPHFLQAAANPDPARYYRVVDTEEEAHLALDDGELPLVVPRSVQTMPIAAGRALVNDVQQRMYEYPGAPFRNAVELLRRGLPARGAESPLNATIVPRYNTETGEAASPTRQPLEGQVRREGPASSIVPSWSTTPASIAPAPEVSPMPMPI